MPAPDRYSPLLDDALVLAAQDFRAKVRKDTSIPYLTHLMQVWVWVAEHGGDEEQQIAAILHDWLEDIPHASEAALTQRFGPRVAALVAGLSDSTTHPKPPWRARKEAYVAALAHKPHDLKLISCADKLHNAQSIRRDLASVGDDVWRRFSAPKEGTLWYYRAVTSALASGWAHPLLDRLTAEVTALHHDARHPLSEPWR